VRGTSAELFGPGRHGGVPGHRLCNGRLEEAHPPAPPLARILLGLGHELIPEDSGTHRLLRDTQAATRIASDLSRRFEAPLTLVYVFERTVYPLPDEYILFTSKQLDYMFAEFNQRLANAQRQALDAGAIGVTTRLLHGWAPDEITSFASEGGLDLIVMGTHGRRGIKHLVLGSVAERVVRMASCPVLTVRKPEHA
jgi:universal stress protein A